MTMLHGAIIAVGSGALGFLFGAVWSASSGGRIDDVDAGDHGPDGTEPEIQPRRLTQIPSEGKGRISADARTWLADTLATPSGTGTDGEAT